MSGLTCQQIVFVTKLVLSVNRSAVCGLGSTPLGFPELKEHAAACTPEWAEKITGVRADDIRRLARECGRSRNVSIRIGVALESTAGGAQAVRAVIALPALTGAWKDVAGGIYQAPLWEFPVNFGAICRRDWIKPGTRVVNLLKLGRGAIGRSEA